MFILIFSVYCHPA